MVQTHNFASKGKLYIKKKLVGNDNDWKKSLILIIPMNDKIYYKTILPFKYDFYFYFIYINSAYLVSQKIIFLF